MSPAEREFMSHYSDLVARYAQACHLEPDDLRAYGGHPPLSANDRVQVRVIRNNHHHNHPSTTGPETSNPLDDHDEHKRDDRNDDDDDDDDDDDGPIVLESGTVVQFTPGSIHYLLWTDVEEYVRNGRLVVLEGEEEA